MDPAHVDSADEKRILAVKNLNLLDTVPEERFDRITRLASRLFSTPVSGIALVDKDRVWFKSIFGLQEKEIKRDESFETNVIKEGGFYIIEDILEDSIYAKNTLVIGGPRLRFYAGVALHDRNNEKVGVFFIADRISRNLSEVESATMKDLTFWVEAELNKYVLVGKEFSGNGKKLSPSEIEDYRKAKQQLEEKQKELTRTLDEERELERKLINSNREIAESKAKDEAMLQNIGDGIIGINDGGEIVYVNKQAENMLGFPEPQLMGNLLIHKIQLVDETDKQVPVEERPIRTALLLKKKVESSGSFYVRADGSKFPVAITATPIVLYNQVIGGVCVFRDITKEYEVDKMKTEFISLASHQLRTPLSAIKWFSEMLIDSEVGKLNDEQYEVASNIYQSNERMIELVNTLLNISRIESGRIIVEPEPTDLKALVDEVVKELRPKIDKKKQNLAVSVHGNLPKINTDPKLVRHVYMNLLTNAIKYSPDESDISVMISKSGNEVISQISDNGYGIPKSQQEKVFQKFFRGENIVKVVTDGTGLGLYLTKTIVDSSGGKIYFESEEGKGTTFWFILPLSGSQKKGGEVSIEA